MIKKIFFNVYVVSVVALLSWLALSCFDIMLDNNSVSPAHSDYNMIGLLLEVFGK
jgi:hypothetical protein